MTMLEKKHFFISYTQADRSWAEWIGWQLEEKEYGVILQAWDFAPGINFLERMDEALKTAERTLLVLTPAAVASKYVKKEWTTALNESRLVPVRVVDFDPDGLLGTHAYIDLVGLTEEEAKERLLLRLRNGRAKPSRAPYFPGLHQDGQRVVSLRPQFPGTADDGTMPDPAADEIDSLEVVAEDSETIDDHERSQDQLLSKSSTSGPRAEAVMSDTGRTVAQRKQKLERLEEPTVETDTTSWVEKLISLWDQHRKVLTTLAIGAFVGFIWYQAGVYSRVANAVTAQSQSYIRHIADRDVDAIAGLAQTPFFFGEQRMQSREDVQAYFVRMFELAADTQRQAAEMIVGPAMYRGVLFSQWTTQTTRLTNFNLVAAAAIDPQLNIYSSSERDDPTGPPPTLDLSDGAARADISFDAFESEQFNAIHLYFSTDAELPRLRGVIMR